MEVLNKIFRTSEIAGIDKYTIEHEPISSLELMERASRIFVENLLKRFKSYRKFAIVAGWGNNGGDGYAVARLLSADGMEVTVYRVMEEMQQSVDCERNCRCWSGVLQEVRGAADFEPEEDVLVIDALFGAGLNRPVKGIAAAVIRKINSLPNRVVAIDVPSGLMGEEPSGGDGGAVVRADYTFTFQFPKLAFMLPESYPFVGEWEVLDIGLHRGFMAEKPTSWHYLTEAGVAALLPRRNKFAHKGTNGHGLLYAGSDGMRGAAILAAKAAVRSGIGLLSLYEPGEGAAVLQQSVPEALLLLQEVKSWDVYSAVAAGCGIGKGEVAVRRLQMLLKNRKGKIVLDADALNILSEHPELFGLLPEGCILTPHPKEFERLAGKSVNDFERLNKMSNFANRYKIYIVLKGAHSIIAAPDGMFYFNMSGNPGMAKGGAGDVLTGVLLALLANGVEPLEAALIGVFAHGLSGDIAAAENGERGVCAGIIAEGMGKAWRRLEAR